MNMECKALIYFSKKSIWLEERRILKYCGRYKVRQDRKSFSLYIFGFCSLFSVVSDSFTTNENLIQGKLFLLILRDFVEFFP